MSQLLECQRVSVYYGLVKALADFELMLQSGETVAVLGPSGSGKSTLMYAVAGFTPVSAGRIIIDGVEVSSRRASVPPEKRPVALVFQNYALWPHLTAVENVAYPLRRAGKPKSQSLSEAASLLEKVGIAELSQRKPGELSGGQQQRVGLARALARSADIYLFDEPTAHLDSALRTAVAEEIRQRRAELGAAAIYATHDSEEALTVADRVIVLRDGTVAQAGTPTEIYEQPADEWAARLTGPLSVIAANVVPGEQDNARVALGGTHLRVDGALPPSGPVRVFVRPEWVHPNGPIRGVVESVAFRGPHTDYVIETGQGSLIARLAGSPVFRAGETGGWEIRRGWVPGPP